MKLSFPSPLRLPFGLKIPQLVFAGLGFVPITCLSISFFGFIPLHVSAKFILVPTLLFMIGLGLKYREWGTLALTGLLAGMLATGAYDIFRLTLVEFGVFRDFIPNIGRLALSDPNASPFWGYLWRFVCNGGCMGMAMGVLPIRGARQGLLYGSFICCCLFATLLFAPSAQNHLFHLSVISGVGAMIGHWVYGSVLGGVMNLWSPLKARQPEIIAPAPIKEIVVTPLPLVSTKAMYR